MANTVGFGETTDTRGKNELTSMSEQVEVMS